MIETNFIEQKSLTLKIPMETKIPLFTDLTISTVMDIFQDITICIKEIKRQNEVKTFLKLLENIFKYQGDIRVISQRQELVFINVEFQEKISYNNFLEQINRLF